MGLQIVTRHSVLLNAGYVLYCVCIVRALTSSKSLKPDNPKAMNFGRQGSPRTTRWENYMLDSERWQRLWDEASEATGISWMDMENDKTTYSHCVEARFCCYRVIWGLS